MRNAHVFVFGRGVCFHARGVSILCFVSNPTSLGALPHAAPLSCALFFNPYRVLPPTCKKRTSRRENAPLESRRKRRSARERERGTPPAVERGRGPHSLSSTTTTTTHPIAHHTHNSDAHRNFGDYDIPPITHTKRTHTPRPNARQRRERERQRRRQALSLAPLHRTRTTAVSEAPTTGSRQASACRPGARAPPRARARCARKRRPSPPPRPRRNRALNTRARARRPPRPAKQPWRTTRTLSSTLRRTCSRWTRSSARR